MRVMLVALGLLFACAKTSSHASCHDAMSNIASVSVAAEEIGDEQKKQIQSELPHNIQQCVASQPPGWVLDCFASSKSIVDVEDCNKAQTQKRKGTR